MELTFLEKKTPAIFCRRSKSAMQTIIDSFFIIYRWTISLESLEKLTRKKYTKEKNQHNSFDEIDRSHRSESEFARRIGTYVFINGVVGRYGIVGNIVITVARNDVIVARYSWRPRHSHYPRLIYTAAVLQVARAWFMATFAMRDPPLDATYGTRVSRLRGYRSLIIDRIADFSKKILRFPTWREFRMRRYILFFSFLYVGHKKMRERRRFVRSKSVENKGRRIFGERICKFLCRLSLIIKIWYHREY